MSRKIFRLVLSGLIILSLWQSQLVFASAENGGFIVDSNIETGVVPPLTLFPVSGSYTNQDKAGNTYNSAKEEDAKSTEGFDKLGLNKVNVKDLEKYIQVALITEKEFYDLNFGMRIAKVALSTSNDLIIRTVDNNYCRIKMSNEYINAMELTGVIKEGSSLKFAGSISSKGNSGNSFGFFLIFLLLSSFLSYFIWFFIMRRKQKALEPSSTLMVNSKDNKEKDAANTAKKVTFDEVQGIDELKPDLLRLVDALKNPAKYKKLGARPTKGLILYGPPGTGKTLIAKAISGEAGVPFFSASGSDFIEKYVGVGASRIRELFNKARKVAPCIVFIDEIDAIGGGRGDSNNSERDQTINALLTELDGFSATEGILTICATNRLDILDPALTRPGRFDLKIAVNLPDKHARYQILKLHSADKKLSEEVDIQSLAKKTSGFSGAELENLLNESALIAATKNAEFIMNVDIEDAFFKIIMNGHKKEKVQDDEYARLIAYHEAGHTLATKLLTNDGVSTVTIVQSTSGAGGVTFRTPDDMPLKSRNYLRNLVKVLYAGRAAEEILLNSEDDITTGASQDIKQATDIIKQYIAIYGMGNNGMIDMTQLTNHFNIIEEASSMAGILYKETLEFLTVHKGKLDSLAGALLDKETLDEPEIDSLIS